MKFVRPFFWLVRRVLEFIFLMKIFEAKFFRQIGLVLSKFKSYADDLEVSKVIRFLGPGGIF